MRQLAFALVAIFQVTAGMASSDKHPPEPELELSCEAARNIVSITKLPSPEKAQQITCEAARELIPLARSKVAADVAVVSLKQNHVAQEILADLMKNGKENMIDKRSGELDLEISCEAVNNIVKSAELPSASPRPISCEMGRKLMPVLRSKLAADRAAADFKQNQVAQEISTDLMKKPQRPGTRTFICKMLAGVTLDDNARLSETPWTRAEVEIDGEFIFDEAKGNMHSSAIIEKFNIIQKGTSSNDIVAQQLWEGTGSVVAEILRIRVWKDTMPFVLFKMDKLYSGTCRVHQGSG
jgi:hypothetical protein